MTEEEGREVEEDERTGEVGIDLTQAMGMERGEVDEVMEVMEVMDDDEDEDAEGWME